LKDVISIPKSLNPLLDFEDLILITVVERLADWTALLLDSEH
jgi:hypothetical protein